MAGDSSSEPAVMVAGRAAENAKSERRQIFPDGSPIIRKSSGVLGGEAVRRVHPLYPHSARAARLSGSVPVEIAIDQQGEVISARAVGGHPLLRDAAVAAALGWMFKPTLIGGSPANVIGTVTFNFQM